MPTWSCTTLGARSVSCGRRAPERIASLTYRHRSPIDYRWHVLARIWRTPILGELFNAVTNRSGFGVMLRRGQPGAAARFVDQLFEDLRPSGKTVLRLYRNTHEFAVALLGDQFRAPDPSAWWTTSARRSSS